MECTKCGATAPENAKFCGGCGADLSASAETVEEVAETTVQPVRPTRKQVILIGTAVAAVALIAAGVFVVRGAAEPKTKAGAELTPTEATATTKVTEPTVTPAADVTPVSEPITTPQKGGDERKALMDAIRRHADNEDLVFIVDALAVQGDEALADVHPTPETDDGSFGRMWVALMRDGSRWRVEESIEPSEPDVDGALKRWPWASRELVEAFFGLQPADAPTPTTSGMPTIESLTAKDIKPGLVFLLENADISETVRVGGPATYEVGFEYRDLADGTRAQIFSNEVSSDPRSAGGNPTLVLKVVNGPEWQSDPQPGKTLPVNTEIIDVR